jgi:hypothetical protein
MRALLLGLSLLGVAVFGGALALSFHDPRLVEAAARDVVRIEVEQRVGERIDRLTDARIAGLARGVLRQSDRDIA